MADDRREITVETVAALVASQFPHWADLPVRPVERDGWDNHTFHIGETLKARLPSASRYVPQVEKEQRLLPGLAPALPLPIPVPVALGKPGHGYDWPWSIYRWLPGETLAAERVSDRLQLAENLASFLKALQRADASHGPLAGQHNFHRGGDLRVYDGETRDCLVRLGDRVDGGGGLALWEAALATRWAAKPVWVHGDIAVGNLLVQDGRLSAVIDFGGLAVGDPACDLVIAWLFFAGSDRAAFKAAMSLDEATWDRARGWALWKALRVAALGGTPHPDERAPLDVVATVIAEFQGR